MSKYSCKILDMIEDALEIFLVDFIKVITCILHIPYNSFHDGFNYYLDLPIRIYYIEKIYYG